MLGEDRFCVVDRPIAMRDILHMIHPEQLFSSLQQLCGDALTSFTQLHSECATRSKHDCLVVWVWTNVVGHEPLDQSIVWIACSDHDEPFLVLQLGEQLPRHVYRRH